MRSHGNFNSLTAHIAFCTLDEVLRPHIFIAFSRFVRGVLLSVMAGLVPATPLRRAPYPPKRDARHKAGHNEREMGNAPQSSLRASSGSMIGMPSRIG